MGTVPNTVAIVVTITRHEASAALTPPNVRPTVKTSILITFIFLLLFSVLIQTNPSHLLLWASY